MRHIYIDSHLDSLTLAGYVEPRQWIFSQGRPWLLLTPKRLSRLAACLGIVDRRVERLLDGVHRHSDQPEEYCRLLGIPEEQCRITPEYPPALCPECDRVHRPHPLDVRQPCPECRKKEEAGVGENPTPGVLRDRERDALARQSLYERAPSLFCGEELHPNWRLNAARRLQRDWDAAVNRIMMGGTYRAVAREFDCSVGLLHKKVQERHFWEDN